MKHIIALLIVLTISITSFGQTQYEMNEDACNKSKKADSTLKSVFKLVKKKFKEDTLFVRKLTKAQQTWIQYREDEMNAVFPHWDDRQYYYGTMFTMCWCLVETTLTEERIKILRKWLDGVEEGDGCTGSIPFKQ